MSEVVPTFEDLLVETGIMGRAEARGEERKALDIAENMVNLGIPLETVVAATKLDPEKVKALYKN